MRQIGTNEATRYELIATNGERTILVGYAARKNRQGGLAMLTEKLSDRLHRLAKATGTRPENWQTARGQIATCDGWTVTFSGRTQREVRTLGELTDSIYEEQYGAA